MALDWLTGTFGMQWVWMALGLTLAVAELVAPGYFLIWAAAAALLTGVVAATVPVGLSAQVILFAVLAALSMAGARRFLVRNPVTEADPLLNHRGAQLVGESGVVTQVITGGSGRIRHGDTEWIARGPDAEPGTRMRIAGVEGTALVVEHLN